MDLANHERVFLRGYAFLTARPHVCAVNVDEGALISGRYPGKDQLEQYSTGLGLPLVEFSGAVELEISALPQSEQEEFLKEYGLQEPGISRIARTLYSHMGLISFFTVGEDEVKAWTIEKGTRAQEAAGKIHSDMERGFIRAEVASFEDFKEHGSMKALRQAGLLRLESKDYIVRDGDIITFRFNV